MALTPIATIERMHASERPEILQNGPVNEENQEKTPVSARMFATTMPTVTSRTAFIAEDNTCTALPIPEYHLLFSRMYLHQYYNPPKFI